MALVALRYKELGMHSSEVDEIWHSFILFTREYAEFCEKVCGQMIHHRPNTSRRPKLPPNSVSTFKEAYTTCFGPVPPIWQARKLIDDELQAAPEILSGDCDVVQAPPPRRILLQNECDSVPAPAERPVNDGGGNASQPDPESDEEAAAEKPRNYGGGG
jgi:hypothetical protein